MGPPPRTFLQSKKKRKSILFASSLEKGLYIFAPCTVCKLILGFYRLENNNSTSELQDFPNVPGSTAPLRSREE
jgi:hypothetical protein